MRPRCALILRDAAYAAHQDEENMRECGRQEGGAASMVTTVDRPVSTIDPFSHGFLRDPYPHHEALREAGPVVWLEQYGIWAMARHPEVRPALTQLQTSFSTGGAGF